MLDDEVYPPPGPYPDIGDTAGITDASGNPVPSPADYFKGRMPDGSIPVAHSVVLQTPIDEPIPGGKEYENPLVKTAAEIKHRANLEAIDQLNKCIRFQERLMEKGEQVLEGKAPIEGVKPDQALRMAQSAARSLPRVIEQRRKLIHATADASVEIDQRRAFMEDRAHAVVAGTLLALDQQFEKVGFGAWMPFRFPDQWLMFCGVMRRVLAANGLIHAREPDVYRKLLEETPCVVAEEDELPHSPRRMPQNWSSCWINRGARSMRELYSRMDEEVWSKPDPYPRI
jgi:hypothetical protein